MTPTTTHIALPNDGSDRSYDVCVGSDLFESAGAFISPFMSRPRTVVVTDENVTASQGARLRAGLENGGISMQEIVLPPGEGTKSVQQLGDLLSQLLELGVERQDVILAFGGGVIGDLVGLAAALLRRGCGFIQIPTSLLAQVDSSVGGKTAVNAPAGKNLIGAFHQPKLVLADTAALQTLPAREWAAGYAEVVKYAALGDASFFDWLTEHHDHTNRPENAASNVAGPTVTEMITRCVKAKADIVAADEMEEGTRALLNLGHTFGHALEAAYGYSSDLLHGEAVAAGMGLAFDFSVARGHCDAAHADRLKTHLKAAGLPTGLGDLPTRGQPITVDELMAAIQQDKKVKDGRLTFILARALGDAFIEDDVDPTELSHFLKTAGAS